MNEKWKMFYMIVKKHRFLYIGAFIAIIFASFFHFVNPLVIKFALDNVIGGQPVEDFFILKIIDSLIKSDSMQVSLVITGLILILLTSMQGLFQFFKGKWSAIASEGIAKDIREVLYRHIQDLPFSEHINAETGDWIQRSTSDIDTIRRFFAVQLIEVGRALLMLILVLPMMLKLSPSLTLYSTMAIPLVFAFAVIFFLKVKKAFLLSDEAEGYLSTVLQENLTGMKVVKAFARQQYEIEKFDVANMDYKDKTYKLIKLLAYYWSISDFICFLQISTILIAGTFLAISKEVSVGTIVVFVSYGTAILFPIRQMGRVLTDTGKASVAWGRIYEILQKKCEFRNKQTKLPEIKGNIIFNKVSMSYSDQVKAISDLSFEVKPGQTIAFMGPSGAGKTSIIKTILRLYDYEGSIKVDGTELNEIDKKWIRCHIGSVLQEPFLYSKTLHENIKITRSEATDKQVEEAAQLAGIHNVIDTFENKYNTLIGERGVNLSGGQKQRVAIARAVIRENPILVFDDSLSAVDTETEFQILEELKQCTNDSTVIIISHRLTSVMHADKIFVMNHGKITQSGTHDDLIEQPGMYKRIWEMQSRLESDLQKEILELKKRKKRIAS